MTAEVAARIFHDWAAENGLMPGGPVTRLLSTTSEFGSVIPQTDSGKQILRSRQISSIAFNEIVPEVIVFTRRTVPASKRQRSLLPQSVAGVPIAFHQGVPGIVGGEPTVASAGPCYSVRTVAGTDFYTCGGSISMGNCRDSGTLGCLVKNGQNAFFGLSNNHVTGGCSFAGVGLPIVAPGIFDVIPGSLAPFTIGYHHAALQFSAGSADNVDPKLNRDAAIFRIAKNARVSSYQGTFYDTPTRVASLSVGQRVEKVGRTTQRTEGTVIGQWHGPHPVNYSTDLYGFRGAVAYEPAFVITGTPSMFSDGGDSGSLITSVNQNGEREAVGLVVGSMVDGSAPGGKVCVALPIEPILTELAVTLVSGLNV